MDGAATPAKISIRGALHFRLITKSNAIRQARNVSAFFDATNNGNRADAVTGRFTTGNVDPN